MYLLYFLIIKMHIFSFLCCVRRWFVYQCCVMFFTSWYINNFEIYFPIVMIKSEERAVFSVVIQMEMQRP